MGIYLDKVTILGKERAISGVIVYDGVALRHTLGEGSLLFGISILLRMYECWAVLLCLDWLSKGYHRGFRWRSVAGVDCFHVMFQFAFAKHPKSEKKRGGKLRKLTTFFRPQPRCASLTILDMSHE